MTITLDLDFIAQTYFILTPFSPVALTGLVGWWDASVTASLTLSGADINAVADQSGGGRTMNWTGFVKPTYSATGFNGSKPAILLGNGSALATASGFPMGTGNTLTAWYVGTMCSSSFSDADARALDYIAAGSGNIDYNDAGSWAIYRNASTTQSLGLVRNVISAVTPSTITAYPAPHRIICTIDSSGLMTIYIDGVVVATATSSGNWVSAGVCQIGTRVVAASGGFWSGPIAEAGVATGYHDATTVTQLDTYLKTKWGL
jgi:hypothetical protein